jgi:UDP-N-acetyl-D-mannosaminuronic acid dehydrogenase
MIANRGYQVIGVDVDPIVVAAITRGETPFVEPDLDKLVRSAVSS